MNISFTDDKTRNASAPNLSFITIRSGALNTTTKERSPPINGTAKPGETNGEASKVEIVAVVIGIILVILIVLTSIAVIALILHLRKSIQHKQDDDHSYSTLSRENTQRTESLNVSTNLYDQIQLSPSTGQAEIISKAEIENINTLSSHQTVPPIVDSEQCNKTTEQGSVSMSEQPTYAAVKKKQKMNKLIKGKESGQHAAAVEKNGVKFVLCSYPATDERDIKQKDQIEVTPTSVHTTESPEALYTAVKKKPKYNTADNEEKVPPPPLHSVEELYTAVKRNAKGGTTEEGIPQIPPHTVEDLYTAVTKKPKNDPTDYDTEAAPPIPPHTVEELYAAVQKGSTAKNEQEAPPIPPHTVEDC